jgi:hypothetical protein
MWIDKHPVVLGYLLGSALVVVLTLLKIVLFYTIDWIIKANILQKNMRKLLPPEEMTFGVKAVKFFGVIFIEALLSWVNVVVILWQVLSSIVRVARDQLQPAPEAIRLLRFPLRNNPDMPRETVWAYIQALGVKGGNQLPTKESLVASLNEIATYHPSFDRVVALKHLQNLDAVSTEIALATLTEVR